MDESGSLLYLDRPSPLNLIRRHLVPHQITLIESNLRQLDPRYTLGDDEKLSAHTKACQKEGSKRVAPVPDKTASACCSLQ